MEERVQKILSASHYCSRREGEQLILAGRVTVDGVVVELGQRADPERQVICVDGKPVTLHVERCTVMLHKPRGFLTTMRDDRGRHTVAELVRDVPVRVYPAGRLDYNTEGLLIMTDDGDLAQGLTHPASEAEKIYETTVCVENGESLDACLPKLGDSIDIDGRYTTPAKVEEIWRYGDQAQVHVTICEGRNRQVRRLCEHAGLHVLRLRRIAEAGLSLGDLPVGCWRYLTPAEIQTLRACRIRENPTAGA